jgi:glycosyltransferase domain-containing protein
MAVPDLTIVVPVHGRQWTLTRSLAYLAAFPGPIIVTDSSDRPWGDAPRFPRVDYRHTPGLDFYQKLNAVLASVTTEFVIDVPDDDFALLSGLEACCAHLRAHPDVVACGGFILTFQTHRGRPIVGQDHSGAFAGLHVAATQTTAAAESIELRLERTFEDPLFINHVVLRTAAARLAWKLVLENPRLRPVRFWDKIYTFCMAAQGRISFIDTVLMLRSLDDRLLEGVTYPAALERDVDIDQLSARVGADGGALAEFLTAKSCASHCTRCGG